jgi:hypothetical protein
MSHPRKQLKLLELAKEGCVDGQKMAKSSSSKRRRVKEDTISKAIQLSLFQVEVLSGLGEKIVDFK